MKVIELQTLEIKPFQPYDLIAADNPIRTHHPMEPIPENAVSTFGYFKYLERCWSNHYTAVLGPQDIWYTILCELAKQIKERPDDYSNLFTTTPGEKQEIVVPTFDVETINPDFVIAELCERVPTKVDDFLPHFSTETPVFKMSMHVAFCDMVSPYYNYSTLLCGIPNIILDGSFEDWDLMGQKLSVIKNLFKGRLNDYLNRCQELVAKIMAAGFGGTDTVNFFSKMFNIRRCGSGDDEVRGWFLHFLNRKDFTQPMDMPELPPHTSELKYTNLDTGRKFSLFAGVIHARIDGGVLVPEYNAYSKEHVKDKPKKKQGLEMPEVVKNMTKDQVDSIILTNYSAKVVNPDFYAKVTIIGDKTGIKLCKECHTDLSDSRWSGWKHDLCPNCAYLAVKSR